jgi:hypothetical protein
MTEDKITGVIMALLLLGFFYHLMRLTSLKFDVSIRTLRAEPTTRLAARWVTLSLVHLKPSPNDYEWRFVVEVTRGNLPPCRTFTETYIGEGIDWFVESTGRAVEYPISSLLDKECATARRKRRLASEDAAVATAEEKRLN